MKTKQFYSVVISLFMCANLLAQLPESFNYQAVARDDAGQVLAAQTFNVLIGIRAGAFDGILVWEEEHTKTSNQFGLFTLEIGDPAVPKTDGTAGSFPEIDWASATHFLQVQIDNGNGYVDMGTSQFLTVPYALVARDVMNGAGVWNTPQPGVVSTGEDVGIGTDLPGGKLEIIGDAGDLVDDPLFEVKRNDGQTVFGVYNEGVRIYVQDEAGKGSKGGFAVGGFDALKGVTNEYLRVTPDSVRVYIENAAKGSKGGFAVGGFDALKKGSESAVNLMKLTRENYIIGHESGNKITTGLYNSFFGYRAGVNNTSGSNNVFIGNMTGNSNAFGTNNVFLGNQAGMSNIGGNNNTLIGNGAGQNNTGNKNTFIGHKAGTENVTGGQNVFIGDDAGQAHKTGFYNVFIGTNAGYSNVSGGGNLFIGQNAGLSNTGTGNIFIGQNAGKDIDGSELFIVDNTSTDNNTSLIYGSFENDLLRFNANIGIFRAPQVGVALAVNGLIEAENLGLPSDIRYKTNIEPIGDAVKSLSHIDGIYYSWNREEFPERNFSEDKQIGIIAQELETVFPELVITNESGYKSVNYIKLTPILIEAVKEQQKTIESLVKRIEVLEGSR